MTKLKKTAAVVLSLLVLFAGSSALFASTSNMPKTPAETLASITGRSVESLIAEKAKTGKTYSMIAKEAGKFTEFKKANLTARKESIKAQAASGRITKERAEALTKAIDKRIAACNGTAPGKIGQDGGAGFGSGGRGAGGGNGTGNGSSKNRN